MPLEPTDEQKAQWNAFLRRNPDAYQQILDAVADELGRDDSDEFACLENNDCLDPGGHLFLATGCEERCLHCKRRTWRR